MTQILTEDLMREVKRLKFRTQRRVTDLFAGNYQSAFKGAGIEFAEVREYEPGDDVRSIDWNVTARSGRTFVKRFVEERQLTVMLGVDVSASGLFGTRGCLKIDLAREVAAVLACAAARGRDRVGLLRFGAGAEEFIPPSTGRNHLLHIYRELLREPALAGGTDIPDAAGLIGGLLRRRALVFLVSDFLAPIEGDEGWERAVKLLNRRHGVIAVRVRDPFESDLPRVGLVRIRDAETGRSRVVDFSRRAARRYAEQARAARGAADKAFGRAGVGVIDVSTDRPFVPALIRAFNRRVGGRR